MIDLGLNQYDNRNSYPVGNKITPANLKQEGKGIATDGQGNKYFHNGNGYIRLPKDFDNKEKLQQSTAETRKASSQPWAAWYSQLFRVRGENEIKKKQKLKLHANSKKKLSIPNRLIYIYSYFPVQIIWRFPHSRLDKLLNTSLYIQFNISVIWIINGNLENARIYNKLKSQINSFDYQYMYMQKQILTDAHFSKSKSKNCKSSKSNANSIVKQAVTELQRIYQSPTLYQNNGQKNLYLSIIDLTWRVCANLCACSKHITDVIDIADILMNNFILGTKIQDSMVGGFVYIGAKYVNEGLNNLLYHINAIKDVVYKSQISMKNSISNQLVLVFQNLNALILPNLSLQLTPLQKVEKLIFNGLMCLARIIEQTRINTNTNQNYKDMVDFQQQFYHRSLKAAKICKISKRASIYKQLLASYFKYISENRLVPVLDICRLLVDALEIKVDVGAQGEKSISSDEQLTGYLIRKCFGLIAQNSDKKGFYIQDYVLTETANKCLSTSPYNKNSKNISQIFQVMLKIKKLYLISEGQFWMEPDSVQSTQRKIAVDHKYQASGEQKVQIYRQVASIYTFVHNVSTFFGNLINGVDMIGEKNNENKVVFIMKCLGKYLKNNLSTLLKLREQTIIYIFDQVIGELFKINSQVSNRCQRKAVPSKQSISLICNWWICAQIQNAIITHPEHRQMRANLYKSYQYHNSFILVTKQYLQEPRQQAQPKRTSLKQRHKGNEQGRMYNIMRVFRDGESLKDSAGSPERLYRYWDQLINYGVTYLEQASTVADINRAASVLKQLIQCQTMILLSHNLAYGQQQKIIELQGKTQKMTGLHNLMIMLNQFTQQTHIKKTVSIVRQKEQNQLDSETHSQQQSLHTSQQRHNNKQLVNQRKRVRKQIVIHLGKYFVMFVVNCIVPYYKQIQKKGDVGYPYEDIFGYFIGTIPAIVHELSLQQRILVSKIRRQLVSKISDRTLHKCRYMYHKTVAFLIQDYHTYCPQNSNAGYLQQYINMFNIEPVKQEATYRFRRSSTRKSVRRTQKIAGTNFQLRYMEQVHAQQPCMQRTRCGLQRQYNCIMYMDFLQWVIAYANSRQLSLLYQHVSTILDNFLQGTTLQQYYQDLLQQTWRYYDTIPKQQILQLDYVLIVAQCVNKLIYVQSGKHKLQPQHKQQQTCGINRLNVQFQMQESALRIKHIHASVMSMYQVCIKVGAFLSGIIYGKRDMNLTEYMDMQWSGGNMYRERLKISIIDYRRLTTCISNILSAAYNIGCRCSTDSEDSHVDNLFQVLCKCKLMLSQVMQSPLQLYCRYAEMVFLGYLPLLLYTKYYQIKSYIKQLANKNSQAVSQDSSGASNKTGTMNVDSLYMSLIRLYTGNVSIKDHDILKTITCNSTLKLMHIVQSIQHMHPHKSLIRSISAYIFHIKQLNQQTILRYQQPLLPITYSVLQQSQYTNRTHSSPGNNCGVVDARQVVRNSLEKISNQIQHRIFEIIVTGILEDLFNNYQISQFRSLLKLAMVYFIKANNVGGSLLTLRCYQTRTKYLNTHQKNSNSAVNSHRKSQVHIYVSNNQKDQGQAQNFVPLNMLSLSDSLSSIMQAIYNSQSTSSSNISKRFKKLEYQRFCTLVLGSSNKKRRTSISFHLSFQSILNNLADSLRDCGEIGSELFRIFGDYACSVFQCYKQYKVYKLYNKMNKKYYEFCDDQNIQYTGSYKVAKQNNFQNQICLKIQEMCLNPKITRQAIQRQVIKQIKQCIKYNFYHAQILQNLLYTIQTQKLVNQTECNQALADSIVLQLSVLMLDHNYVYKKMIESVQPLVFNHDDNLHYLVSLQQINRKYEQYILDYVPNFEKKLKFLQQSTKLKIKHPMTVIYPFGCKIYVINLQSPILVLNIDRYQFDQFINTVDNLIANNSKLLNDKNVDPKQWWKSRDRVDRSIGKIANQIDVGTWDVAVSQSNCLQGLSIEGKKVWKLAYSVMKGGCGDCKKVKQLLNKINVQNKDSINIEQIIIKVDSYIKKHQQSNKYKAKQLDNLLLITHHHYTLFPFQGNSYLSRQRAVYRIPSFQYLLQQCQRATANQVKIINIANTKFLINSANDLPQTQKSFYKIKQNFKEWKGIIGKKPTLNQFVQLWESQAYLYMGHGAGCSHLRQRQLYCKNINALMMLFGCSSASIAQGKCQNNGVAHSHLMNGSPGVLGCLWQVTDRDTDKVTENIFKIVAQYPQNLSKILGNSKKKCKHQFLNGGAIVIFGLPIYAYIK